MGACTKASDKGNHELVASQKKEILDQLPTEAEKENAPTKSSSDNIKEKE